MTAYKHNSVPPDALVEFLTAAERAIAQLRRRVIAASDSEVEAETESIVLRGEWQERIARLIDFHGEDGLTAKEVAAQVQYDEANTYAVLKSLQDAGLLEAIDRKPRRWRYAEKHRANDVIAVGFVLRPGEWTTYGDISVAVYGNKGGARAVGRIAAKDPAFPHAYRVLDRQGKVRPDWSGYGGGPERCRELLEAEGVAFTKGIADPTKRISFEELEGRLESPERAA